MLTYPINKYEENKTKLREEIRNGTINILEAELEYGIRCCYLCLESIEGKAWIIIKKDTIKEIEIRALDDICYQNCKQSLYYKKPLFSLN